MIAQKTKFLILFMLLINFKQIKMSFVHMDLFYKNFLKENLEAFLVWYTCSCSTD
jgi:thiamine kinase-like enzyme